jgi:hypothetical protein
MESKLKMIAISVIWVVTGALAAYLKDANVLGYAAGGTFILLFL